MAGQDLEQIREVFLKARALPADQRPAYLLVACGGDAALQREVEQLLGADGEETFAASGAARADGAETAVLEPTAPSTFPVNSLPAGYRFVRELGRGGQAVVCAAVQESTGKTVAIKIMREGPLADASKRARFDREAEVLAALRHPHIVTILDRGIAADHSQYIVMDYVPGRTLGEWLRQHAEGTKPEDGGGLRLFVKICSAVNAAHLRGIVHRDIKPSNILVDERGEPFVLDFGLARPVFDTRAVDAPATLTGQFLGSLPWSSPEQAEGDPDKIDTRTDVYALGVVLYQLLTGGQFPYEVAGNMRDVLNNILTAEPTPPSRVMAARQARERQRRMVRRPSRPVVNAVIEAIVLKALSKRRDDRYETAGELGREIAGYLAGQPTIAAGQKVLKRRGRNRMVGGALFAMALLLFGALIWNVASRRSRNGARGEGHQTDAGKPVVLTPPTVEARDAKEFTNSIGMKFTRIEPGEFLMGSPASEEGRNGDETQHKVKLTNPFFLGTYHVTRGQFATFVKDTGYRSDAEKAGLAIAWAGTHMGKVNGASWKNPGFDQTDDHPVVEVSWNDAQAFCDWLSQREGKRYRLPTEAEWEYACRARTQTAYFWGDNPDGGAGFANCADLTAKDIFSGWRDTPEGPTNFNWRDGYFFTSPTASFKPNSWGLYDVTGNAQQWCLDAYHGAYGASDAMDPGPSDQTADISSRVCRGGSWFMGPRGCRAADRGWHAPAEAHADYGFRICLDIAAISPPVQLPPDAPKSGPSASARQDRVVDLMPLIDPARDGITGTWTSGVGGLSVSAENSVEKWSLRLALPYCPPAEYDLRIEFTRTARVGDIQQMLSHNGARFSYGIDMWPQLHINLAGFQRTKNGNPSGPGPGHVLRPAPIENGRRHVSIIRVRDGSVSATLDGQAVVDLATDYTTISPWNSWDLGIPVLGVGAWDCDVVFHAIEVTEISGRGELRVPPAALLTLQHSGTVFCARFSSDGKRIITASGDSNGFLQIWDAISGRRLATLIGDEGGSASLSVSRDGRRIVTSGMTKGVNMNGVNVWDADAERIIAFIRWDAGHLGCATISPDGTRVATACEDNAVRVWDAGSGKQLLALSGRTVAVRGAAYSPDGTKISTASDGGSARVWDAISGKCLAVCHEPDGPIQSVEFSPDGARIVTAAPHGVARVWDAADGRELVALPADQPVHAEFSPDGARIVTASADGTARLWDAHSGELISSFTGHTSQLTWAAFSPDGKRIVTASQDRTVRVWNAEDRRQTTNSVGMKLVEVRPGSFLMGSPADETGRGNDETLHNVRLTEPFFLGVRHVTRGQFAAFVKDSAYRTDAEKEGWGYALDGSKFVEARGVSWQAPGFDQTDEHPVVEVSWNDAQAFCQWLSKKEGKRYRLPTEAEWEYACRAGTQTAYFWGDNPDSGAGFANCADLAAKDKFNWDGVFNWRDGYVFTSPVGSFKPNPWGLCDMIGNAWQWCGDAYGPYNGGAPLQLGPQAGSLRVLRGGAWGNAPRGCRAACRRSAPPDRRSADLGFRVALDFEAPQPIDSPATRPSPPNAPAGPIAVRPDGFIDLLPLVDLSRDVVQGRWRRTADGIESAGDSLSRIRVPYRPPLEYDIISEFTIGRLGPKYCDVNFMCSSDHHNFICMMGASDNRWCLLNSVNGCSFNGNPTMSVHPALLTVGHRYHAKIEVSSKSVEVFLDNRLTIEWAAKNGELKFDGDWAIGSDVLGFGSNDQVTFHSMSIRETTGKGHLISGAAPANPAESAKEPYGHPLKSVSLLEFKPVSTQVGWGTFMTNAHPDDYDVMLGGKPCDHYLFAQALSSLIYEVPKGAARFQATGVSPRQKFNPNFRFVVCVDGDTAYQAFDSKNVRDLDGEVAIDVPLPPDARRIELRVEPIGSGVGGNHAIWAEPRFLVDQMSPVPPSIRKPTTGDSSHQK